MNFNQGKAKREGVPSAGTAKMAAMTAEAEVLLVDDDVEEGRRFAAGLEKAGFRVRVVSDVASAAAEIADRPQRFSILVCDYRLNGEETGFDVLHAARRFGLTIPAVLILGPGEAGVVGDREDFFQARLIRPVLQDELTVAVECVLKQAGSGAVS